MAIVRVAAYYRVSSAQQRDADTIASQRTFVHRVVAQRGWELVAEYEDDGRSVRTGKQHRRVGMPRMLAAARSGAFEVVVVVDSDRLARSEDLIERAEVYGTLQRAGVRLSIAGAEPRPADDAMVQIKAMFDAEENRKRADRSRRGRERTVAAGRAPTSPPFGYTTDAGRVVERAGAVEAVRTAFERVAGGETCARTAHAFQTEGIPTSRKGRWCAARIVRIIRCTAYDTGRWAASNGVTIPVPVIVDADLAARARQRLAGYRLQGLRHTRHVYLLEGIATCELCGSPIRIHGSITRRLGKVYRYTYYVCDRVRVPGGAPCPTKRHNTEDVDAGVWAEVQRVVEDPAFLEEALASRGAGATADGARALADLDDWRRRLDSTTALELEALALREKNALSAPALAVRLAELGRRRRALEQQIATAEAMSRGAVADARAVADLRAAINKLRGECSFADTGPEDRRRIVREVCSAWSVGPAEVRGEEEISGAGRALVVMAS